MPLATIISTGLPSLLASAVLACLAGPATGHAVDNAITDILPGPQAHRNSLVSIVDRANCIVKLENSANAYHAILRLAEIDPASIEAHPDGGFLRFSGRETILELRHADRGTILKASSVQISTNDPDRDAEELKILLAGYCPALSS